MRFARVLYIFTHVAIWLPIVLILSPLPFGLLEFTVDPLSPGETTFFFLYGTILNLVLFYVYAHNSLPPFLKNRKAYVFLFTNALYLLGFTLGESFIDFLFFLAVHPEEKMQIPSFFLTNGISNVIMLIAANLYGFSYDWIRQQKIRGELEQEKLKAELSALKHQIHPHFLFNSLNALYGMALKSNDEDTAEGIAKLSHMMRYVLYESFDDRVPLIKELEYIRNYLDLQRMRLQDKVEITFEVKGNPEEVEIGSMIYIPFVENAFKHGISTTFSSWVHISCEVHEKQILFMIDNSVHKRSFEVEEKMYGGIGIKNVRKRLQLLYKGAFDLTIKQDHSLYQVVIAIPKKLQ
ncbi:MAG: histidine kinase [Bacteroidota bacterium]